MTNMSKSNKNMDHRKLTIPSIRPNPYPFLVLSNFTVINPRFLPFFYLFFLIYGLIWFVCWFFIESCKKKNKENDE